VTDPLTSTVSVSRKLGDNDYGNGEVFISLNGISMETTQEDMEELLDAKAALAFKLLKKAVLIKVTKVIE
jgi:hypothetical protein